MRTYVPSVHVKKQNRRDNFKAMTEENFDIQSASPAETFDEATRNYKKIKRSGKKKFRYLHTWNYKKSIYLLKETGRNTIRSQKVFKRGSIIYADFGINIGSEFSMPHFAIVLNKSDNRYNEKLTVIPLTSVVHNHTIELDNTIGDSSLEYLDQSITDSMTFMYVVLLIMDNVMKSDQNEILSTQFIKELEQTKTANKLVDPVLQRVKNLKKAFAYVRDHLSKVEGKDPGSITDEVIKNYVTKEKFSDIAKDFNLLKNVFDMYKKYNKKTYARVQDLTTISKTRIRKINYYDPIGKIRASSETLDRIEKALQDFLFKN